MFTFFFHKLLWPSFSAFNFLSSPLRKDLCPFGYFRLFPYGPVTSWNMFALRWCELSWVENIFLAAASQPWGQFQADPDHSLFGLTSWLGRAWNTMDLDLTVSNWESSKRTWNLRNWHRLVEPLGQIHLDKVWIDSVPRHVSLPSEYLFEHVLKSFESSCHSTMQAPILRLALFVGLELWRPPRCGLLPLSWIVMQSLTLLFPFIS